MKVLRFIAGVVGLLIVIPVVALGIFLATFNADSFKKDMMAQASQKLGREVAINGPVKIDFSEGLSLNMQNVVVGSPEGFASKDFASIGDLFIFINIPALLDRAVEINKLTMRDARITLQTSASGKNNWDFAAAAEPAKSETPPLTGSESPSGFRIERMELSKLELNNTVIIQMDGKSGKSQEYAFDDARFDMPRGGALTADVKGRYNAAPVEVMLNAEKGISDLITGKPTPIDIKAAYAGEKYVVKAMLARNAKQIDLTHLEARVKDMDWTGDLYIATSGAKPAITGNLSAAEVDLTRLAPARQAAVSIMNPKATLIAAEVKVGPDLQFLSAITADVKLAIGKLVATPNVTMEKVATQAKITNGWLQLTDLTFIMLGTPYRGLAEIDGRVTGKPVIRVALEGKNIDLPQLAKNFGTKLPVDSRGDILADLKMSGTTPEAMMASLSGKLEVAMGPGAFDMGGADETAIGIVKFAFPAGAVQAKPRLSCAAMRFNAMNGVLTTNGMVMDANLATVAGEGTIDLAGQTINLLLKSVPKDSKAASLLAVPVRITGSTAHPSFMPQEEAIVQKAASLLAGARGPVSTGVPQVNPVASGNACLAALNNPQPIMVTPPAPKEVLKETVDQVKDRLGQGKDALKSARDALKGGSSDPKETLDRLKGIFGR